MKITKSEFENLQKISKLSSTVSFINNEGKTAVAASDDLGTCLMYMELNDQSESIANPISIPSSSINSLIKFINEPEITVELEDTNCKFIVDNTDVNIPCLVSSDVNQALLDQFNKVEGESNTYITDEVYSTLSNLTLTLTSSLLTPVALEFKDDKAYSASTVEMIIAENPFKDSFSLPPTSLIHLMPTFNAPEFTFTNAEDILVLSDGSVSVIIQKGLETPTPEIEETSSNAFKVQDLGDFINKLRLTKIPVESVDLSPLTLEFNNDKLKVTALALNGKETITTSRVEGEGEASIKISSNILLNTIAKLKTDELVVIPQESFLKVDGGDFVSYIGALF